MAECIEITGGKILNGSVQTSGAKNAVLPLMIASLLSSEPCEFENVPNLEDVNLLSHLLENFGAEVDVSSGKAKVSVPRLLATEASYSLVKALRASFWVLAPLLARGRAARVALPGGDIIGARPVDMHLAALTQMGADIRVRHGVVYATAVDGLKPASIELRSPSVGATHQVLMAAALVPGTTVIKGAACEPEVVALAEMINQMGASIEGAGTSEIVIRGREYLSGAKVKVIGDRIEAGTYLLSGAVTGGTVRVTGIRPEFFGNFLEILNDMGLTVEQGEDFVQVARKGDLLPVNLSTSPFPGLATDLQAPLMAALCFAKGKSSIEENIFEGRFAHVAELCRLGARINVEERTATVHGGERLSGAPVEGNDIRAAAALVVAGLGAEGVTHIHEAHHLRRGYEQLETKLSRLGAVIGLKQLDGEDYMFAGC